jgi:uncharacterized membrane protein YqaE (UPF0057 family)
MYQARKVNGQIHTSTKPEKSTVRYIHVPSQKRQRSDTYMYQARKVNGHIHTSTKPGWLSWLSTCMYLTVYFPGLVHVCIWPLTFLAWGKSTVRYIHVPSQKSQRSDTYMYQARKVNGHIHTCTKPGKSTVRYIHVLSQEYMYVSDRWLFWLSTCMYLTVDFPGLVHVCIWPLTFLA